MRALILTLALLSGTSHAALRNGSGGGTTPMPTTPQPTNPTPITGGGSPTLVCVLFPLTCLR